MSDDTMTENTTDDEEVIAPRPRTMRRAAPVESPDEPEPAIAPRPRRQASAAASDEANTPEQPDESDDSDASPAAPIHAGWTAGQQVMDATSLYAQALKLAENVQIIKFLEDQPYANYRRHWVERMTPKGPSTRPYTCLETVGRDCPLCDIADRPQAVSAFNVVLVGDDGQVLLRTWDVGPRLFNVLKAFATDPKVGPLSRGYFAVSQTGRKSTTQTNVVPIRANRLEEDYEIPEPTADLLKRAGLYDASVIQIPKKSDLEEVASELAEYE